MIRQNSTPGEMLSSTHKDDDNKSQNFNHKSYNNTENMSHYCKQSKLETRSHLSTACHSTTSSPNSNFKIEVSQCLSPKVTVTCLNEEPNQVSPAHSLDQDIYSQSKNEKCYTETFSSSTEINLVENHPSREIQTKQVNYKRTRFRNRSLPENTFMIQENFDMPYDADYQFSLKDQILQSNNNQENFTSFKFLKNASTPTYEGSLHTCSFQSPSSGTVLNRSHTSTEISANETLRSLLKVVTQLSLESDVEEAPQQKLKDPRGHNVSFSDIIYRQSPNYRAYSDEDTEDSKEYFPSQSPVISIHTEKSKTISEDLFSFVIDESQYQLIAGAATAPAAMISDADQILSTLLDSVCSDTNISNALYGTNYSNCHDNSKPSFLDTALPYQEALIEKEQIDWNDNNLLSEHEKKCIFTYTNVPKTVYTEPNIKEIQQYAKNDSSNLSDVQNCQSLMHSLKLPPTHPKYMSSSQIQLIRDLNMQAPNYNMNIKNYNYEQNLFLQNQKFHKHFNSIMCSESQGLGWEAQVSESREFKKVYADDRDRMVYVSWIPKRARAHNTNEKRKMELELKQKLREHLSFGSLTKVLLFPPKGVHCKLIFNSPKSAAAFIEIYGGDNHSPQTEKWKIDLCRIYDINMRDKFDKTVVKIEWSQK